MNALEFWWSKKNYESEKAKLEKQIHQIDELIQMKNNTEALRDMLRQREIQLRTPAQPKEKIVGKKEVKKEEKKSEPLSQIEIKEIVDQL